MEKFKILIILNILIEILLSFKKFVKLKLWEWNKEKIWLVC